MKKFLSILLTLCLMLTVVAVPLPAIAETSNKTVFDFEDYDTYTYKASSVTPNIYIKWSGRVREIEEDGNTVIKFDNNGMPYQNATVAKAAGYANSCVKNADGTYTKFANTQLAADATAEGIALKTAFEADIDANGCENYYNLTASYGAFKDTKDPYDHMEMYNAIELDALEVSTKYRITINYKRESLEDPLYVCPVTWAESANKRATMTVYSDARVTIPTTAAADSEYVTVSTVIETPAPFVTSGTHVGDTLRLVLYTGEANANNVVYFDNITVEKYIGSVTYNVSEGASVGGEEVDSAYVVKYYGDDTPVFPTVTYSDGRIVDHWTDDEGTTVDVPELNGSYTAVTKEMVTVQFSKGGTIDETLTKTVEKGEKITLPDTEFTDTSWWSNETAYDAEKFVGYEGEEIDVDENTILYTTETYASGLVTKGNTSIYGNWTEVKTGTEDGSYLYKEVTSEASTTWAHGAGTRLCTRLGVVEDGNTYKISVTYKATTDVPLNFVMVISAVDNGGGSMRSYLENGNAFHTVSGNTNGWKTVTYYITADTPHEVTPNNNGLDDTKVSRGFETLYLMVNKAAGYDNVEIAIKETKVVDLGKVVEAKGASVLTEGSALEAGSQAIRYYFDYATNEGGDGTKITIDGNDYDVVERGFLYTNGDIDHYAGAGSNGEYFVSAWSNTTYGYGVSFQMWLAKANVASGKNLLTYKGIKEGFDNNWELKDDTVTFSTYVTNIPKTEDGLNVKMMVRGYVIFEADGVQHIVYSETINRSVKGIKDALDAGSAGNDTEHVE